MSNQEQSDAMSTYFLEAEGGEGLEAAVLKTIFGFPPHAHDLVVHVHLQSGAISVRNQSISRQYSLSVAISRYQSPSAAISGHQSRTAISVGTKSS